MKRPFGRSRLVWTRAQGCRDFAQTLLSGSGVLITIRITCLFLARSVCPSLRDYVLSRTRCPEKIVAPPRGSNAGTNSAVVNVYVVVLAQYRSLCFCLLRG